uniref:Low molecular weight phosphotyrosine protein phosphatase n=1 Tax=Acrobeloides nanus TaxID=290746 RepID=A0A914DZW7_9BILA
MAEAIFIYLLKQRSITDKWIVDSAGIANYHVGKGPNRRAADTLRNHGISDFQHRARQITEDDFVTFDYIFCMDYYNITTLEKLAQRLKVPKKAQIDLLGNYDPDGEQEIEDPYCAISMNEFEQVYQQCLRSCMGFLDSLNK